MPVKKPDQKQDQVLVACPHCGHQQPEARSGFSSVCKQCHGHFRIQDVLHPVAKARPAAPQQRRVICFECGAELDIPASAESSMCKKCSRYLDLHDYLITTALAKNFRTKGKLLIEPKGCVFNTDSIAGEVVIRGKFHGKLVAEQSLTICNGSDIKGSLKAAHLIIPVDTHFRWADRLSIGSAEITGELVANLHATGTVTLKATARCFGDIDAVGLVVEEGAIIVGNLRINPTPPRCSGVSAACPP